MFTLPETDPHSPHFDRDYFDLCARNAADLADAYGIGAEDVEEMLTDPDPVLREAGRILVARNHAIIR